MINKRKNEIPLEKDIISGLIFLVFAIGMFITSFSIKHLVTSQIGPSFMPKVVSGGLILFSLGIVFNGIKKQKLATGVVEEEAVEGAPEKSMISVVLTIILIAVYAAVFNILGFIVATILYLFVQMILLAPKSEKGKLRQYIVFAVISMVVTAAVYYIFLHGFGLDLPSGILD